jgi:hypothetical protein
MIFGKKKPKITRQDQLLAKPVRLVEPDTVRRDDGGANLKIPLKQTGVAKWLLKMPQGASKTYELDQMGVFVWDAIDGKTSVQQLIRRLSKRYTVSLRESEVSTLTFLNMLTRKGLIGMELKDRSKKKEDE